MLTDSPVESKALSSYRTDNNSTPTGITCLTVMYHYVRQTTGQTGLGIRAVSPPDFEKQLDLLCSHCEPICWVTMLRWLRGECEIPRNSFLLTFDDGLKDHIDTVAPALDRRGLHGVFFVTTQTLLERRPLSAHLLHALLDAVEPAELLNAICEAVNERGWSDADRLDAADWRADLVYHYEPCTIRQLKYTVNFRLPGDQRYQILNRLYERHVGPISGFVDANYMNSEDVRRLYDAGHTIGGHGHRHEPYLTLTAAEQWDDLQRCRSELENLLPGADAPFSYPLGSFDMDTMERCQRAGFSVAFSTEPQRARFSSDCFNLPRIDVMNLDLHLRNESC